MWQQLDRTARGDEDYEYECRLLMPDGEVTRADRQVSETGEEELVGAVMDVTATRKAQEALQRLSRRAILVSRFFRRSAESA